MRFNEIRSSASIFRGFIHFSTRIENEMQRDGNNLYFCAWKKRKIIVACIDKAMQSEMRNDYSNCTIENKCCFSRQSSQLWIQCYDNFIWTKITEMIGEKNKQKIEKNSSGRWQFMSISVPIVIVENESHITSYFHFSSLPPINCEFYLHAFILVWMSGTTLFTFLFSYLIITPFLFSGPSKIIGLRVVMAKNDVFAVNHLFDLRKCYSIALRTERNNALKNRKNVMLFVVKKHWNQKTSEKCHEKIKWRWIRNEWQKH